MKTTGVNGAHGAGTVAIAAGSGVTIASAGNLLSLRTQYSVATLRKRGTDTWLLPGTGGNAWWSVSVSGGDGVYTPVFHSLQVAKA